MPPRVNQVGISLPAPMCPLATQTRLCGFYPLTGRIHPVFIYAEGLTAGVPWPLLGVAMLIRVFPTRDFATPAPHQPAASARK